MRISIISLLLLGVALAAPIHELEDDRRGRESQQDSLVVRGLVPVSARAFVAPKPIAHNPVVPKPVTPGQPVDSAPPPRLGVPESPSSVDAPVPINGPDAAVPVDGPDALPPPRSEEVDAPQDHPDTPGLQPDTPSAKPPPPRLTGGGSCVIKRNGVLKRGPCATVPVPSVADIKTYLKIDPDTSLFYSGPPGFGYHYKAEAWRQTNAPKYKLFGETWTDLSWKKNYKRTEPWGIEFDKRASAAMVRISQSKSCSKIERIDALLIMSFADFVYLGRESCRYRVCHAT
jgi:hypothetical protein